MGFWFWFWVWSGLIAAALGVFAWLLWDLFTKVTPIIDQLKVSAERIRSLMETLEKPFAYEAPTSAMDEDPEQVFAKRALVVRRKEKRAEERERRLIRSLLDIDVYESRFTNAP